MPINWGELKNIFKGKVTTQVFSGSPLPPTVQETEKLLAAEMLAEINAKKAAKSAEIERKKALALAIKKEQEEAERLRREQAAAKLNPPITWGTMAPGSLAEFRKNNPYASAKAIDDFIKKNLD